MRLALACSRGAPASATDERTASPIWRSTAVRWKCGPTKPRSRPATWRCRPKRERRSPKHCLPPRFRPTAMATDIAMATAMEMATASMAPRITRPRRTKPQRRSPARRTTAPATAPRAKKEMATRISRTLGPSSWSPAPAKSGYAGQVSPPGPRPSDSSIADLLPSVKPRLSAQGLTELSEPDQQHRSSAVVRRAASPCAVRWKCARRPCASTCPANRPGTVRPSYWALKSHSGRSAAAIAKSAGVRVHTLSISGDVDAVVAQVAQICQAGPAPHLFITTASDGLPIDPTDEVSWARQRHETMVLPFFVCQKWGRTGEPKANGSIAAPSWRRLPTGGDFGFSRGSGIGPRGRARGRPVEGHFRRIYDHAGPEEPPASR